MLNSSQINCTLNLYKPFYQILNSSWGLVCTILPSCQVLANWTLSLLFHKFTSILYPLQSLAWTRFGVKFSSFSAVLLLDFLCFWIFLFGIYWMLNLSGTYSILLVLYMVGKALRWGMLPEWEVCPRWSKWWIQILVMPLSEGLNVHKELTRNLMKCKNCSTNVRCLPHSGGNLTFFLSALQLH